MRADSTADGHRWCVSNVTSAYCGSGLHTSFVAKVGFVVWVRGLGFINSKSNRRYRKLRGEGRVRVLGFGVRGLGSWSGV